MLADVLILAPESPKDQILTYMIPQEWEMECVPGSVFKAPVLNQFREALVLNLHNRTPEGIRLKALDQNLFDGPVLNPVALALAQWISDYYACSMNKAVALFIPPQIRKRREKRWFLDEECVRRNETALFENPLEEALLALFRKPEGLTAGQIQAKLGQNGWNLAQSWIQKGYTREVTNYIPQVSVKESFQLHLALDLSEIKEIKGWNRRAPKQKALLNALAEGPVDLDILKKRGLIVPGLVNRLAQKGWIRIRSKRAQRDPMTETLRQKEPPSRLMPEQSQALKAILKDVEAGVHQEHLIFGVTGSGKTEVFLRAAGAVIAKSRQVLYLVPEIALTPQVAVNAAQRFEGKVAILHSAMTLGERYDEWERVRNRDAWLIIGPRSALFAPFQDLGMIIIDEEHETTYKQSEPDPRYDARKTAEVLAKLHQAVLIRGSATPSLLTYSRAMAGEVAMSQLPGRVGRRAMPAVELVNMSKEMKEGWRKPLSRPLLEALNAVVAKGEQAILLMNRRGYHTYVLCRECGKSLLCPRCSISMTYHKNGEILMCHYCGEKRRAPARCPVCGSAALQYMGTGTERVADALKAALPGYPILRMDMDTTRGKGSHTAILKAFQDQRAQVLVGTQMVAKGLDFPRVTLVGVIHVDGLLNLPDYQGAERTFQLVVQAAGRAGRGERPGKVMIQTFDPSNPLFQTIGQYDYNACYEKEIQFRRLMEYPPKVHLARILISSKNENAGMLLASRLTDFIDKIKMKEITVLGPAPAPVFRVRERIRHHIILRCPAAEALTGLLNQVRRWLLQLDAEPRVILDMDPQTLL
jgi:primosomal protein N' (replication factor Y)